MAKASKVTIVEVEELVEPGEILPHEIHVPSVYVKRIIVGKSYEKRIERLTLRDDDAGQTKEKSKADKVRETIAREYTVQCYHLHLQEGLLWSSKMECMVS